MPKNLLNLAKKHTNAMAALPRGIQLVKWTNATDGSVSMRYRVRVQRKDFKADNLYTEVSEALQFLTLTKSPRGRSILINDIKAQANKEEEEKRKKDKEDFELLINTRLMANAVDSYKTVVIDPMPEEEELDRRNKGNRLSFLSTILKTDIEKVLEADRGGIFRQESFKTQKTKFGLIPVDQLTSFDINAYITARLKAGRTKSSVSREVSIISQVIENERAIFPVFAEKPNPALVYNRNLLKNRTVKKKIRITKEEQEKIFEALDEYPNPQMKQVVELALATACRRSELITLRWDMVKDTHIALERTKSGEPRNVYLTDEAKETLKSIERKDHEPRLFWSYSSIAGFEGSFSKLMKDKLKINHITFHTFRKEAFSRFFDNIGDENTSILAQFLGVKSVRKFEELHAPKIPKDLKSVRSIKQSGGHSDGDITNKHYYTPDFESVKK